MAPKDDNDTARSVNALVDLLSAAALDSIDNNLLDREAHHCVLEMRQSRDSLSDDPQVWDREVEKLIRQLRESLRDTPERDIEGLQDPDELLRPSAVPERKPDYVEPQQHSREAEEGNDDRRQYLKRELSTASYPKIGPGYSDSISVVSDLTMPTVVQGVEISEEENYLGLPMSIGFTPKPRSRLRRPSLENKSSGGRGGGGDSSPSGGGGDPKDRRAAQQRLRPPSRRVVTRPGGAAANRRQNHQATMAHLKASTPVLNSGRSPKSDEKAASVAMSVNDFPSLKDASRGGASDKVKPQQRRGSERRSLLRKSNKYAASVSATTSQRMLLAHQEDVKKKRSNRRRSTGDKNGFPGVEASGAAAPAAAPLTDDFGFLIGGEAQTDPFTASAFTAEFPPSFDTTNIDHNASISSNNSASNPFFPASSKDTKKKKGSNRRASMSGKTSLGKPKK